MHDLIKTIRATLVFPVHPEGWPFVVAFALGSVVLAAISDVLGLIGAVLTLWCLYFFRNPKRVVPDRAGLIVSPADGLVQKIEMVALPPEINTDDQTDVTLAAERVTRISIFLNVFDVHVNRVPASGVVNQVIYHPGKFLNASLDKASIDNERSTVVMKLADKENASLVFVQIAGLVARRIVNTLTPNQDVACGDVYGLIRFGSRMDVYLPPGVNPLVIEGQRAIGGETVLADLTSQESTRTGKEK